MTPEGGGQPLEFRVLGPLEVWRNGSPVRVGGERQRAVLALLLLRANEVVATDQLVEALFGLEAPETASNSLQAAVSRLRQRLDPEVLLTRPRGYLLRVPPDRLDLIRFEELVARGGRMLAEDDAASATATLREALGLWRGPPLADLSNLEFAAAEIRRLDALRLAALVQRVDADLALGHHAEILPELDSLVAANPLQERLCGQLMLALYRSGRQADALEAFRRTRDVLDNELGLAPSRALRDLERSILRHDPSLELRPDGAHEGQVVCPFKGLASFGAGDADYYYGRERPVADLVARLADSTFVGVIGPSGSGKSSLVQAGLLSALAGGALPGSGGWAVTVIRPDGHHLDDLPAAGRDQRRVLVVDQLEEVFTACDEEERAAFLERLVELAEDRDRCTLVVVALRADFYGHCARYASFASLLSSGHLLLGPMERDELAHAITGPAERAGLEVEPELVDALVADVAGEPGALPLLSTSLLEIWRLRDGRKLRLRSYRQAAGVHGAVARLAENAFAKLAETERPVARAVLLRLAGVDDSAVVRRRVPLEDVAGDAAAARVVAVLTEARLLTVSDGALEVSHEAVLTEWPRLREWLAEDREGRRIQARLAARARDWSEGGCEPAELYRGARLSAVLEWAVGREHELNEVEREFLAESRKDAEREATRQRRQNRRLRVALAGVGVLLALAIAAGVVALKQRRSAEAAATAALAHQLGAEAVSEPRIDRAMLLAREAVNLNRSTATEGTLLATLLRSPEALGTFAFPIQARPLALSLSPDGRTLAVSDSLGEIRLFDTRTHSERRPPLRNIGLGLAVPYSPDGSLLAALKPMGEPPGLALLDARTLDVVRVLPFDPRFTLNTTPLDPFEIAPDDRTVFLTFAVLKPDRSDGPAYLDLWSTATARRTTIRLGSNGILGAEFVAAGKRIVTITDTQITTWDARTLRRLHTVRQPVSRDAVIADVSSDGRTVAVGTSFGSVTFVDVATGRATPGDAAHSGAVEQLRFSPDGSVMVSGGTDAKIIVWDTATAQPLRTLAGHGSQVTGVAFSRDGRTLFTASPDGVIFEWDLGAQRRFGQPFTATSAPPRLSFDAQLSPPPLAISPSGSDFAVRAGASSVALYATRSLRRLHRFAVQAGGDVIGLAWSSLGELAVTGDGGRVQLWDARGRPRLVRALRGLRSLNGKREAVTTTAFSPDGRMVAAADMNHTPAAVPYLLGTLAVWKTTGKRLWMTTGHGRISAVAFSPDGRTIAACRDDGAVFLYDARTGHLERTLHAEGTGDLFFTTAAYTPDGRMLATGTAAGIVQLWNPATGAQIGHPTAVAAAPVASIAFDPAGDTFATAGGSDGLAKLWTTKTQQQFGATFPGDPGRWGNAQYTPDGSKLVVVYDDGTGVVWPVSLPAWEDHACAVAGRNLTREEWSRFIGNRRYSAACAVERSFVSDSHGQ